MIDNHVVARLKALFRDKLHLHVESGGTDLLESGLLDSLTLVDLLLHLETDFGLRVSLEELDLEAFRTLDRIAAKVAAAR